MNNSHLIQSLDKLQPLYGKPRPSSQRKIHTCLTDSMQQWLQHSPFFILSSCGADGIDCSPRGDAPGEAFKIIDQHQILIPDRQGNNRIDTLKNILHDPRVGLVFLIPDVEEMIRIKGTAVISVDPALLQRFVLDGKQPASIITITVISAYVQNARAIRQSKLWQGLKADDAKVVPSAEDLCQ